MVVFLVLWCAQQPLSKRSVPVCHAVQGRSWPPGGLGLLFCPCHVCSLPELQNNLMKGLQNGSSQPWPLLFSSCELAELVATAILAQLRAAAVLYQWGILSQTALLGGTGLQVGLHSLAALGQGVSWGF